MGTKSPNKAATILDRIDSLPGRERRKLFDMLLHHPANEPVRTLMAEVDTLLGRLNDVRKQQRNTAKLELLIAKAEHAKTTVDNGESYFREVADSCSMQIDTFKLLRTAQRRIRARIPQRQMASERIESAEAYIGLRDKHGKQRLALEALVRLASERDKDYSKDYLERGEYTYDDLRNYVNQLMRTYAKHQEKKAVDAANLPTDAEIAAAIAALDKLRRTTTRSKGLRKK
jgi:hypothetical protein